MKVKAAVGGGGSWEEARGFTLHTVDTAEARGAAEKSWGGTTTCRFCGDHRPLLKSPPHIYHIACFLILMPLLGSFVSESYDPRIRRLTFLPSHCCLPSTHTQLMPCAAAHAWFSPSCTFVTGGVEVQACGVVSYIDVDATPMGRTDPDVMCLT